MSTYANPYAMEPSVTTIIFKLTLLYASLLLWICWIQWIHWQCQSKRKNSNNWLFLIIHCSNLWIISLYLLLLIVDIRISCSCNAIRKYWVMFTPCRSENESETTSKWICTDFQSKIFLLFLCILFLGCHFSINKLNVD